MPPAPTVDSSGLHDAQNNSSSCVAAVLITELQVDLSGRVEQYRGPCMAPPGTS